MSTLTILRQDTRVKKVILVDLRYPYGKSKVYMNSSLVTVAAQLMAAGLEVDVVDFNIDNHRDARVRQLFAAADVIGVSVLGAPYIPSAIEFCRAARRDYPSARLWLGGQTVAKLELGQFSALFGETAAVQIRSDADIVWQLGRPIPAFHEVALRPVWERMGDERLALCLSREFGFVVSQGCGFNCSFCGAEKDQQEKFRNLTPFSADLGYLAAKARQFDLARLEMYASSLDFFQSCQVLAEYLRVVGRVRRETGIDLRLRALTCMTTFLNASRTIEGFVKLVREAGVWCLGFGVDGTDERVWKDQRKTQNRLSDVAACIELCDAAGIRPEILMVLGFASDNATTLWKNFKNSLRFVLRWPSVMLRPYLAKVFIPGNEAWQSSASVSLLLERPALFYNLDFCSVGSPLTHPRKLHRWMSNLTYLAIIFLFRPFGRCCTSPLLPQGQGGAYGKLAKLVNRYVPFDR